MTSSLSPGVTTIASEGANPFADEASRLAQEKVGFNTDHLGSSIDIQVTDRNTAVHPTRNLRKLCGTLADDCQGASPLGTPWRSNILESKEP